MLKRLILILSFLSVVAISLLILSGKKKFKEGECVAYSNMKFNKYVSDVMITKIIDSNFIQYKIIECHTDPKVDQTGKSCKWVKNKQRFINAKFLDSNYYSIPCISVENINENKLGE